jgi:hypothetical protein
MPLCPMAVLIAFGDGGDPTTIAQYFGLRNCLGCLLHPSLSLLVPQCFLLNSMAYVLEVIAPGLGQQYSYFHTAPASQSRLLVMTASMHPHYHLQSHVAPIVPVAFCFHLRPSSLPVGFRLKPRFLGVRIVAIALRVLVGILSDGRVNVSDYLECAQDLLSPETLSE